MFSTRNLDVGIRRYQDLDNILISNPKILDFHNIRDTFLRVSVYRDYTTQLSLAVRTQLWLKQLGKLWNFKSSNVFDSKSWYRDPPVSGFR